MMLLIMLFLVICLYPLGNFRSLLPILKLYLLFLCIESPYTHTRRNIHMHNFRYSLFANILPIIYYGLPLFSAMTYLSVYFESVSMLLEWNLTIKLKGNILNLHWYRKIWKATSKTSHQLIKRIYQLHQGKFILGWFNINILEMCYVTMWEWRGKTWSSTYVEKELKICSSFNG